MEVTTLIRKLLYRVDDGLLNLVDEIIQNPLSGPVSPEVLNPLLGLVLGRLDVNLDRLQSTENSTFPRYMHLTTLRSSIESLLNNPLLYAYTSAIILLSYYIWKEYDERNRNQQSGQRSKETGDRIPKTGEGLSPRGPAQIRGNKNL